MRLHGKVGVLQHPHPSEPLKPEWHLPPGLVDLIEPRTPETTS